MYLYGVMEYPEDHIPETQPVQEPPPLVEDTAVTMPMEESDLSKRYLDVYQWRRPDEVVEVRWRGDAYVLRCANGVALQIQVVASDTLRLCYSPDGRFREGPSYAVDPSFRPSSPVATLDENEKEYVLTAGMLHAVISKQGLKVRFFNADDQLLLEDADGYAARRTVMEGWSVLQTTFRCRSRDVFYGMGDKASAARLNGRRVEHWCTDAFGYDADTDPLYRAIPVFFALHQGRSYGVLLDNTHRTFFDFDSLGERRLVMGADGGDLNYYFFTGADPTTVVEAYARLTGVHALPPLWALGYQQCRWSYYPEDRVLDIARTFRALRIPCDAIYLDIDYMDGYRCFTWNQERFPDPAGLVQQLRDMGFRTVLMLDPGIKEDPEYAVYQEGVEQGHFLQTADGDLYHAPVWPGFCAFPDFTRAETRFWWGEQYKGLLESGASGFWNDMNEPAVFHVRHKTLPDHIHHCGDGHPGSHRRYHNVYGQQMNRAGWEGLRRLQPDRRPFLLSRATYSGGQRFAAVWTGDNWSTWEHLQIANVQCQRLSVSGLSFCGSDVGGFAGVPEPELFVRWLQLSVFHLLMRVHSMGQHISGDALTDDAQLSDPALHRLDQEPWSFGDKWTTMARKAIELRYALLPCLYTVCWQHVARGTPAIRHAFMEDPGNEHLIEQDRDFMFGQHILVSPVIQPKINRQEVVLPVGLWYYFWNGQPARGRVTVHPVPDEIPFFIRAGAVLPIYPVQQYTGAQPIGELTLYVYYNEGTCTSQLYQDEGDGYAYTQGIYRLSSFITEGNKEAFSLRQTVEGTFSPSYEKVLIYLVGFPVFARQCLVDGIEVPIREIRLKDRSVYTVIADSSFKGVVWRSVWQDTVGADSN
jgi:alpha-glucosidase